MVIDSVLLIYSIRRRATQHVQCAGPYLHKKNRVKRGKRERSWKKGTKGIASDRKMIAMSHKRANKI